MLLSGLGIMLSAGIAGNYIISAPRESNTLFGELLEAFAIFVTITAFSILISRSICLLANIGTSDDNAVPNVKPKWIYTVIILCVSYGIATIINLKGYDIHNTTRQEYFFELLPLISVVCLTVSLVFQREAYKIHEDAKSRLKTNLSPSDLRQLNPYMNVSWEIGCAGDNDDILFVHIGEHYVDLGILRKLYADGYRFEAHQPEIPRITKTDYFTASNDQEARGIVTDRIVDMILDQFLSWGDNKCSNEE